MSNSDESVESAVWISRRSPDAAQPATAVGALTGTSVGVKDNIDVAGLPTTAGCPAFAYAPERTAVCVERLEAAGAVVIGKTNMDQFATGLVGTRSPFGALSSVADPSVISGGSSSGSAVAVASGQCDIALGTDTAGSGRVPAALNGIVGLKPTRGLVPTTGVVPACESLDCVSVFASTVAQARVALAAMLVADEHEDGAVFRPDRLARLAAPRVGVPSPGQLEFFGDVEGPGLFASALERLAACGARIVEVDIEPLLAAGDLLYDGPWVAERLAAVGAFIRAHPAQVDPIVRDVIMAAAELTAVDAFRGIAELERLVRQASAIWSQVDLLALPTVAIAPTHDAVAEDPHGVNAQLGHYTRFVNLMDLCAIAIPAGRWSGGVPFSLQLVAPAMQDAFVCDVAERFERSGWGAETIQLAVVGAHLCGQPLNHQLTERRARLCALTRTAPEYRLFRLAESVPPKPGLMHVGEDGAAIEVEVWELDAAAFGSFVAQVPPPLAIGTVRLASGQDVKGFVCEPRALDGAEEITVYGGWRAYREAGATIS